MNLKECITHFTKRNGTISAYIHDIKAIFDELTIINSKLDDVDLVIYSLNGIGPESQHINYCLCSWNLVNFEDFHDLLTEFENYLKRDESVTWNFSIHVIAMIHAALKGKQQPHMHAMTSSESQSYFRFTSLVVPKV